MYTSAGRWIKKGFLPGLFFLIVSYIPLYADEGIPAIAIRQGEVFLYTLPVLPHIQSVIGQFQNTSIPFFKVSSEKENRYAALIGADLAQAPARYPLYITRVGGEEKIKEEVVVEVLPSVFGVQTLTLPKEKVDLNAKTLARVEEEASQFQNTFSKSADEKMWQNSFWVPIEGEIAGTFGQKRVINGQEKNPHTGEDIAAPLGTKIVASNNGKAILVGDFFYNGHSIVLDHGGGLFTMYFHLSEIKVKEGAVVERGEVIGLVGQSGRATGPHLHWGARLHGARVNPFSLVKAIK